MSDNAKSFAQILQEIQQVFPKAGESHVRRIADNIINEITIERNLKRKTTPINSVDGQAHYDLSTYGQMKITRVDFMDSDGEYVLIPRILDGETIRKWETT